MSDTPSLVDILNLETIDVDLYRGASPDTQRQRVFGGQVAGQALVAAGRTVDPDRHVHSLHAYFLRPGDTTVPIVYHVDRIRDGRSFTTRRVVASQRGRVIKSIGDSVLFVNDDTVRAYDTAEGIIQVIGRDPRMPDVRVGLASGSVVMRLGDVFGPPVNMAARLTNVARRNRIIIDSGTAARLPADQFETRRMAARPVRGFGIVEPVAVRRH